MKKRFMFWGMMLMAAAGTVSVQAADETVEEQVLLDENGVKITAKELDVDGGWMGPELKLLIENNTENNLTVQTRTESVNGYMTETLFSADVAAGKKVNDGITFSDSDLKKCGIDTIADMEFSFHIFDTESWDTYMDTARIQVETSSWDGYTYTFDDDGEVLYEDSMIRIVNKGVIEEDSLFGPEVMLFIENRSQQSYTVQVRDVSVNGFMVDPMFSEDITPGKCSIAGMTFMESDLEENGIESIDEIELSFHVFDMESWDTLLDTAPMMFGF